MSTKEIVVAVKDDKQEIQKQLGCMNGIFQLFDRRYLLGQRRHGHNQKRLPPGQSENGEKKVSNGSEQAKENNPKEKQRVSTESSRNSFSSSSSSTAISSFDCSKRLQTEQSSCSQSVISEPSLSPSLRRKKPDLFIQSPDIRDVVKESMTREPRVVSIKTVTKDERAGPPMKHIDSPRPFPQQKPDRNDRNLVIIKEQSRYSCDGRESRYLSKPNMKVKELPRLSLDSRQGYIRTSAIDDMESRRPSSSVVARLMGLEALTASVDQSLTLKSKPQKEELLVSKSKSSRKDEELKLKNQRSSVSPKARKNVVSPQRGVGHVITKIPLETAPWKQEGTGRVKTSIYGEIEKRLTEHEYKTAGKDLRALKQILEAMQKTKSRLENNEQKSDNSIDNKSELPISPKVKPADVRKDLVGRQRLKERRPDGRQLSTSNFPECSGSLSPRMQRAKNGVDKSKVKTSMSRTPLGSPTRTPKVKVKVKPVDMLQLRGNNGVSQHSETISFQTDSNDSEATSVDWMQEVNSVFRPKENHKSNIIVERLTQEKSTVDQHKHTVEQPSPVSVLDAFYTEDTPSPVKKRTYVFSDDENLQFEEPQDQYSEFNNMKLENIKNLVHQIELLNTNTEASPFNSNTQDHEYITEILLASGLFNDLDHTTTIVQLHPTSSLINPNLFNVLEKTKGCIELTDYGYHRKNTKSKSNEKIRRKLVFDTVNDVLGHKLAIFSPFGQRTKGKILNGEKLVKELCSEIDDLENNSEIGIYDEDDEVINIINADVNKRSQDWDELCNEVPGLVLDIERLIFKDLISEVVNAQVNCLQDWPARHRRQLFYV